MYIMWGGYVMCIRVCVLYSCMCICVRLYVFVLCMYGCDLISLFLSFNPCPPRCFVVCCNDVYPLVRFKPNNSRFRFVFAECRYDRRFKNRQHEMIRRSSLIRAVQTRWQFGPEIASFHVSVCIVCCCLFIIINDCLSYLVILLVHFIISCE